jgi:hypothetical protein
MADQVVGLAEPERVSVAVFPGESFDAIAELVDTGLEGAFEGDKLGTLHGRLLKKCGIKDAKKSGDGT